MHAAEPGHAGEPAAAGVTAVHAAEAHGGQGGGHVAAVGAAGGCLERDGRSTTRRGGVVHAILRGAAGPHPYNNFEGRGTRRVALGRTQVVWWKETRRNQPTFYFSNRRAEFTDRNDPARLA
jgi:hypothetical protein